MLSLPLGSLPEAAPKSRQDRRREDTRRRLMKAAYELLARRGFEGVFIQEITERADVGYGSFYNHFLSKEGIASAVIDAARLHIEQIHECLGGLSADFTEAFAIELRVMLHLCKTNERWGWFVINSILSGQDLRFGVRDILKRGVDSGISNGAFKYGDVEMAYEIIGGLLLLGTLKLVSEETPEDYPARIVSTALEALRVPGHKIKDVMSKPLPEIDLPSFLEAAA